MTIATITITTIRAAIKWRQYFLDGNSKIRNIQIQKKTTDKWNFRFGNVQKPTATKRETDKQTTLLSCLHSRDFTDNKTMTRNNKIWNRKKIHLPFAFNQCCQFLCCTSNLTTFRNYKNIKEKYLYYNFL